MNCLTQLTTNVYLIPERLKEIDPHYFVVRNHQKGVFEIHHNNQPHTTYCLTVPYPELDCRTLELVRKTAIHNLDKLIAQMDEENQKRERETQKLPQEAAEKTKEVLLYLNRHESEEWVDDDAFTARFL